MQRDDAAAGGDRGGNARQLQRREHDLSLAVPRVRQRWLQARRGRRPCDIHLEERGRIQERLGAKRLRQLREVGVARHDDAPVEIHATVRDFVFGIVAHRARHAPQVVADPSIRQPLAGERVLVVVFPQRRARDQQLESGSRRIETVTRAVEEAVPLILVGGDDSVGLGPRVTVWEMLRDPESSRAGVTVVSK